MNRSPRSANRFATCWTRTAARQPGAPMTSPATWLVDTSALARLSVPEVGEVLRPLIDAGCVAVTAVTLLEVGSTARSRADHERTQLSVLERF